VRRQDKDLTNKKEERPAGREGEKERKAFTPGKDYQIARGGRN